MSMFLSGALAGLLMGGFAGCMAMALFIAGKQADAEFGPETGTDTYLPIRARYEQECG